ncbi:MAG: CBS domain-containing protein [Planctomycetota bacterium]|jgi:CBS domain-containing protein|nr:CBS domain-containing protein [Planctomycetota bacterium]
MRTAVIMTPDPLSIAPTASVVQALKKMDKACVRHLPVIGESGRLEGVISDRDLLEDAGWCSRPSLRAEDGAEHRARVSVGEVMREAPITATPDDPLVSAVVDMVGRGIGCLPVLTDGELVGIVTERDIVEAYLLHVAARPPTLRADDPSVGHLMSWHPVTVETEATLAQARNTMLADGFRHLPVVESGRQVGIVSDRDLRRAYGSGCAKDTPVEEIMTRDVSTVTADSHAHIAGALFVERRISAVSVLDPAGGDSVPVGIVTVTDLLDHCLSVLRDGPVTAAG